MIYIFEGMDNCGKSTALEKLLRYNHNPARLLVHSIKPPVTGDQLQWSKEHYEYLLRTSVALSDAGTDVYLDRAHLGEAVYGPLYRNTDPSWVYDLERSTGLIDADVCLTVLIGDPDGMTARDDGLSISAEHYLDESSLFTAAYQASSIRDKRLFNVDQHTFKPLDKYISVLTQEHT